MFQKNAWTGPHVSRRYSRGVLQKQSYDNVQFGPIHSCTLSKY